MCHLAWHIPVGDCRNITIMARYPPPIVYNTLLRSADVVPRWHSRMNLDRSSGSLNDVDLETGIESETERGRRERALKTRVQHFLFSLVKPLRERRALRYSIF